MAAAAAGGDGGGEPDIFRPQHQEIIDNFLRPKMAGQSLPAAAGFIHDVDVYSAAPDELAAAHAPAPGPADATPVWYFFSPVRYYHGSRHTTYARRVGDGRLWSKDTPMERHATDGGAVVWYRRQFRFVDLSRRDPHTNKVARPDWKMVEYGITKGDAGQQQLVLCKLFRSPPPGAGRKRASSSSAATAGTGNRIPTMGKKNSSASPTR